MGEEKTEVYVLSITFYVILFHLSNLEWTLNYELTTSKRKNG